MTLHQTGQEGSGLPPSANFSSHSLSPSHFRSKHRYNGRARLLPRAQLSRSVGASPARVCVQSRLRCCGTTDLFVSLAGGSRQQETTSTRGGRRRWPRFRATCWRLGIRRARRRCPTSKQMRGTGKDQCKTQDSQKTQVTEKCSDRGWAGGRGLKWCCNHQPR